MPSKKQAILYSYAKHCTTTCSSTENQVGPSFSPCDENMVAVKSDLSKHSPSEENIVQSDLCASMCISPSKNPLVVVSKSLAQDLAMKVFNGNKITRAELNIEL